MKIFKNKFFQAPLVILLAILCLVLFNLQVAQQIRQASSLLSVLETRTIERLYEAKKIVQITAFFFSQHTFTQEEEEEQLKLIVSQDPDMWSHFVVTDKNGVEYIHTDGEEYYGISIDDKESFYIADQRRISAIAEPSVSKSTGAKIIAIGTPVYKNGEYDAVLVGCIYLSNVSNYLNSADNHLSQNGYVVMVNTSDGKISSHPNEEYILSKNINEILSNNVSEKIKSFQKGYTIEKVDGVLSLVVYQPLSVYNLSIAIIIPATKIMTAIFSENTTLLLLIITVIVMSMLLHYILQKNKDLLKNQYDKQIQELSLIAEQDQLTGLYNKKTIEGFIKNHIKENHEENGALFIIDVDNFKTINDTLGHLFGDMVLEQLAAKLKGLFRENDLLGRIGGDEFFVFIKNMTDDDIVTQKATLIVEAFNNTYSSDEESVQVSASIGVALFPQHGRTLDVLYEKADIALYDTKIKGKNGYTIYSGNKASKYISNRDTSIENSSSTGFSVAPEKTVFNLLYSVKNQDFAINSVLQLIGEKYGACRASIFMLEKDNTLKNTFEWRGAGVPSRMNLLQKVEQHTFANVVNELIENQIYIATSIEQVQSSWLHHDLTKNEIKSFFLQALYVNCDFIGFISFDYCKEGFIPKNEDLNNIASISQILALFLKLNSYK